MLPQTISAVHRPLACDKKYSLCLYDLLQSAVGEEGSKVGQGDPLNPLNPLNPALLWLKERGTLTLLVRLAAVRASAAFGVTVGEGGLIEVVKIPSIRSRFRSHT